MIGLAMLAIGAVFLWAAFTKRGDAVFEALKMSLPAATAPSAETTGNGSPANGGTAPASVGSDIGSHMGLDASGKPFIIDKAYAAMTDAEKDAANKFARQLDNLGSTAYA